MTDYETEDLKLRGKQHKAEMKRAMGERLTRLLEIVLILLTLGATTYFNIQSQDTAQKDSDARQAEFLHEKKKLALEFEQSLLEKIASVVSGFQTEWAFKTEDEKNKEFRIFSDTWAKQFREVLPSAELVFGGCSGSDPPRDETQSISCSLKMVYESLHGANNAADVTRNPIELSAQLMTLCHKRVLERSEEINLQSTP